MIRLHTKIIFAFFVLLYGLSALGQNSTVSFTIQDPTGQVFSGGTLSYVIVPTGTYTFNGSPLSSIYYSNQTVNLDSTGSGSISSLPRNDYITPIGTQWQFTVCPNASATCTTLNVIINQATQNISAAINAVIPPIKINAQAIPRAYSDSEVTTTIAEGGMYYNTGTITPGLRYWNGSAFVAVGGGGGGAVDLVENTDGTLTISPTTGNVVASLNLAHANTWTGSQSYSDGAGTPSKIVNYNDPTAGEGQYYYVGATQMGGIIQNAASGGMTIFSTTAGANFAFCIDSLCSGADILLYYTAGSPNLWTLEPVDADMVFHTGSYGVNVNGMIIGNTNPSSSITAASGGSTTYNDTAQLIWAINGTPVTTMTSSSITDAQAHIAPSYATNGSSQGADFLAVGTGTIPATGAPTNFAGWVGPSSGTPNYLASLPNTNPAAAEYMILNPVSTVGGQNQSAITTVPYVADTTTTTPTTAIGAASGGIDSCGSVVTVTMTGFTTAMTASFMPTSDTYNSGTANGWNQGLYIRPWAASANTPSYRICNPTSSSLTPSAITLNVSAR